MPVERRGWVTNVGSGQPATGGNPMINGRRQPSLGGTSRMMREYHVRICEGLGVKLPGSTRKAHSVSHRGRGPSIRGKICRDNAGKGLDSAGAHSNLQGLWIRAYGRVKQRI